ncbi:hypothetical protein CDAR_570071 [Caerostris darwini]|uniref:Uncharacterized protein n=1 Tax=Caerostris darwini TaxID=1538125 RepID=A0AAV4S100_9ARAC|nr:hypothetical protein CDAR_570061 [Caerostris darwini]GIY26418.1 hypothetical protein CDAR_570071 [Caerostris darwini]
MFSPFFEPRKNRLQKCTLCPSPFFPFHSHRPIRELGENCGPRAARAKMTFSQISRSCDSRLNGITRGSPINTKMAAATVVGGKVPPTKTQKMLSLLELSEKYPFPL